MNRAEWKELCKTNHKEGYYWYNKARKKLLSKEFESDDRTDKGAKIIHHLRDTEEQRKYNDEHYEMFGFEVDENGNEVFNYGKYVVFWTKEHHDEYHHSSKETREKLSESLKLTFSTEEQKAKRSAQRRSEWNDERKLKYSVMFSGENNGNYGKKASDELRKRLSDSHKGIKYSEESKIKRSQSLKEHYKLNPRSRETCDKISKAISGENNPNYGRIYTDDEKECLRRKSTDFYKPLSLLYKVYRKYGGVQLWQNFANFIKNGGITFEEIKPSVYTDQFRTLITDDNRVQQPFKVTKDRSIMCKLYRQRGGELKWNDFQKLIADGGEIHLGVINTGDEPVQIKTGEKLVQFMHLPVLHTFFQEVSSEDFDKLKPDSNRGCCGFGSSGSF